MTIVEEWKRIDCVFCHGKSHTSIEVLLCAQQCTKQTTWLGIKGTGVI